MEKMAGVSEAAGGGEGRVDLIKMSKETLKN